MKNLPLAFITFATIALAACGNSEVTTDAGSGSGGASATGGVNGNGGVTATGGNASGGATGTGGGVGTGGGGAGGAGGARASGGTSGGTGVRRGLAPGAARREPAASVPGHIGDRRRYRPRRARWISRISRQARNRRHDHHRRNDSNRRGTNQPQGNDRNRRQQQCPRQRQLGLFPRSTAPTSVRIPAAPRHLRERARPTHPRSSGLIQVFRIRRDHSGSVDVGASTYSSINGGMTTSTSAAPRLRGRQHGDEIYLPSKSRSPTTRTYYVERRVGTIRRARREPRSWSLGRPPGASPPRAAAPTNKAAVGWRWTARRRSARCRYDSTSSPPTTPPPSPSPSPTAPATRSSTSSRRAT